MRSLSPCSPRRVPVLISAAEVCFVQIGTAEDYPVEIGPAETWGYFTVVLSPTVPVSDATLEDIVVLLIIHLIQMTSNVICTC
jgi:hypothetical protein